MQKNTFTLGIISFLILGTLVSQYEYARVETERPDVPLSAVPAPVLKTLDLGLHSALASLLWVRITQDVYTWITGYENLAAGIQLVNALDPKWSYPYAFGTIMLPNLGTTPEEKERNGKYAIEVGEQGIKNAESDWRIPYYLATAYHMTFKDRTNAAKYFNLAASTPGAPENIVKVAANYGTGKNDRTEMKQIWQAIAENSKDEGLRVRAETYVEYINYLETLDGAKLEYKNKTGQDAKSFDDLLRVGILKEIPKNPLGN